MAEPKPWLDGWPVVEAEPCFPCRIGAWALWLAAANSVVVKELLEGDQ